MAAHHEPQPHSLQESIRALLRGAIPAAGPGADPIGAALRRYECGGYLHREWQRAGRTGELPGDWAAGLREAHRRTAIDSLAALAGLRSAGRILAAAGIPFILLKGGAYLDDLYDDPGARMLTDIDLLIRPADAAGAGRCLRSAGYRPVPGDAHPGYPRAEVALPGGHHCSLEVHWQLGPAGRYAVDEEAIWAEARRGELEGVPCLRLQPEDALVFHAAHAADHYFGPTLKWAIDLREMFRRWPIAPERLLQRASAWGARTALHVAARQVESLFPGEAPPALIAGLAPGRLRARLLEPYLAGAPVEIFGIDRRRPWRSLARLLLLDGPAAAAAQVLRVLLRPAAGFAPDPARAAWDGAFR